MSALCPEGNVTFILAVDMWVCLPEKQIVFPGYCLYKYILEASLEQRETSALQNKEECERPMRIYLLTISVPHFCPILASDKPSRCHSDSHSATWTEAGTNPSSYIAFHWDY